MSTRRVVVTGIGAITPLGHHPDALFQNLMAGKSGIRHLQTAFADALDCKLAASIDDFDPLAYFSKNQAATMDRTTQFAVAASRNAVDDAKLELEVENCERIGVYIGSGMVGANAIEDSYSRLFREEAKRLKPYTVLMAMNNAASAQVALDFGLLGPDITFCTACSSSAIAIGEAVRQIRHGYTDVILAGGAESLLTYGTMKAWEALRTLASEDEENPAASCKPFSLNRTGLILGEGSAMFVLEEMDRAIARGAHIYGEIVGYGTSNDSAHITQPSVGGQARAMQHALKDAAITPAEIDYINAHGTGTKLNDAVETAAIKQVIGNQTPVSSTKSMHGHLMGASSAVEFAACLMAIKHQAIPPTANLSMPDPELDLDYVPNVGREKVKVDVVMSNSFAFGGTGGVLIARKL